MFHLRFAATAFAVAVCAALCSPASALAGSVRADVTAKVAGQYTGSTGLGATSFSMDQIAVASFTPGTGTGKADVLFADRRTLAASATENLDLAGALTDPVGGAATFGHVKAIYVKAALTNTNNVVVGGAASNAFAGPLGGTTPTVSLPPGGFQLFVHPGAGWTVTAATGDLLKVTNSAGSTGVQYDVMIIGTSN